MTTVSSKHTARDINDPPMTKMVGNTRVDDLDIIRKLCLPEKCNPNARNASHLTFGTAEKGPMLSTNRADFVPPEDGHTESKDLREARCQYMREKHFPMGYHTDPPQSESRSVFVPHGRQREKKIFNIGAPHNKTASNVYVGSDDLKNWADDCASTNRADFVNPNMKKPNKMNHAREHNSNHFTLGNDVPDKESYTKQCYKGPGPGYKRQMPLKGAESSVQFGTKDFPWAKEANSTSRGDYCKPFVAEEDALTNFVQSGPPMKFGDDSREMLTENRSAFKNNQFMDCSGLSDAQLTMLGVTREQIIPRKVPLPFLQPEVFKNALGQHFEKAS